jgi:hypothetical protein
MWGRCQFSFPVACEPARPPCLTGDLVSGRAAGRARLNGQGEGGCPLARGQYGRHVLMQPLESFAQIADQMPPIENVLGLWCSKVTAADDNAWMRSEPRDKRIGHTVGNRSIGQWRYKSA